MIGLALGLIIGLGGALLLGKLKGRNYELFMAIFGVPVFTYAISVASAQDWFKNTYLCLWTCMHPLQWAGIEVLVSYLIGFTYFYIRSRKALSIDDYIQLAYLSIGVSACSVTLSATLLHPLLLPGLALYIYLLWPREGIPLRFLCVEKVGTLGGAECYTDGGGKMAFKSGNLLFVGGLTVKEFPAWKELAECLLRIPDRGKSEVMLLLAVGFLPSLVLFTIPEGIPAVLAYGGIVIATQVLLGWFSTWRTRKNLPDCSSVLVKYSEFLRKNKGKLDIVID